MATDKFNSDNKYTSFCIVLQVRDDGFHREISIGHLNGALQNLVNDKYNCRASYYMILHDKDKLENGESKEPHYHIVIEVPYAKRTRVKTMFNLIREYVECTENIISIDTCVDVCSSVQYLIHKNNPEKYQYDISEIFHNNESRLNYLMKDIGNLELLTGELLEIIEQETSYNAICKKIGIKNFSRYANIIRLMFEETRTTKAFSEDYRA
jgi:hypothetical protein